MGMSAEDAAEIAGVAARDAVEDDFVMWRENRVALDLFCFLDTQWRVAGMGGVIGLDYGACMAVMPAFKVRDTRAMMEDLRAMELAALEVLNKSDEANGG